MVRQEIVSAILSITLVLSVPQSAMSSPSLNDAVTGEQISSEQNFVAASYERSHFGELLMLDAIGKDIT